ncbi:MAG: class I SAM-dependent methyltransferase [Syntrophales bacterium]|nr:class I SAM-dependent methyltransferase [Syntrophales bacterium]
MNQEKPNFDQAAASWDENPGRIKLADDVASAIRREITLTKDMDVLDYGCGTGLITLGIQPFVNTVTGIDSSEGMLNILADKISRQKLTNVSARHLDMEAGEMLPDRFHLIVSSMTLHHIRHPEILIKQLSENLHAGGALCIADLDPDDGLFHGENQAAFHPGFERSHMKDMFEKAGFQHIRDSAAARIIKDIEEGVSREFSVFLVTGRK